MSIVKKSTNLVPEEWKDVTFLVFDAPKHGGVYEERIEYLKKITKGKKFLKFVGVTKCQGKQTKNPTNKHTYKPTNKIK